MGKAHCHNPNLGLTTKARACKNAKQERSSGGTSYTPRNVGECERMNPHTPKWAPTLGVGIPMDSWIFRERFQGLKPIGLKSFLYHWKIIEIKMGLHDSFGHLKHKLWPKKRLGVKLTIWLPTIKNRESTRFPCVQVVYDIPLESSGRRLQLFFGSHLNQRFALKVMGP
jgi:hypothetical protein